MPFQNLSQARACYAKQNQGEAGSWDCGEWSEHTDFKHLPKGKKKEASMQQLARLGQQAAENHLLTKLSADTRLGQQLLVKMAASVGVPVLVFCKEAYADPKSFIAWLQKEAARVNIADTAKKSIQPSGKHEILQGEPGYGPSEPDPRRIGGQEAAGLESLRQRSHSPLSPGLGGAVGPEGEASLAELSKSTLKSKRVPLAEWPAERLGQSTPWMGKAVAEPAAAAGKPGFFKGLLGRAGRNPGKSLGVGIAGLGGLAALLAARGGVSPGEASGARGLDFISKAPTGVGGKPPATGAAPPADGGGATPPAGGATPPAASAGASGSAAGPAGAMAGKGMSPVLKALLLGGGAVGLGTLIARARRKKKEQLKYSIDKADVVSRLEGILLKKAGDLYRRQSVQALSVHLDQLAPRLTLEKQARVRVLQGELASGKTLAYAIKRAYPQLTGEQRGLLAAQMVRSACKRASSPSCDDMPGKPMMKKKKQETYHGPIGKVSMFD